MDIRVSTKGRTAVHDLTGQLTKQLKESALKNGTATLFVIGSTAGITTIEYEPGLVKDIKIAYEKVAPEEGHYHHHDTWGDDNGNAHVRASMLGPSLVVPFVDGAFRLGTWQQVILVDFDTRPRKREVLVQFMGE